MKIQDGGGRHLYVNNFGLDKDILKNIYGKMHHGHADMTT